MWWWIALGLVVLVAAGYGLHRAALWAERRGWIYYSKDRPRPLPIGMLEEIYHPSIEHLVVELGEEAIRADQDESGEGKPDEE